MRPFVDDDAIMAVHTIRNSRVIPIPSDSMTSESLFRRVLVMKDKSADELVCDVIHEFATSDDPKTFSVSFPHVSSWIMCIYFGVDDSLQVSENPKFQTLPRPLVPGTEL